MGLVSIRLYRLRGPFQVTVLIDIYIYIYIMIIMASDDGGEADTPFLQRPRSARRAPAVRLGCWAYGIWGPLKHLNKAGIGFRV